MADQGRYGGHGHYAEEVARCLTDCCRYAEADPEGCLHKARRFAEAVCMHIHGVHVGPPGTRKLDDLLRALRGGGHVRGMILQSLEVIQRYGNQGSHVQPEPTRIEPEDVTVCLAAVARVARWFYQDHLAQPLPPEVAATLQRLSRPSGASSSTTPPPAVGAPLTPAPTRRWRLAVALLAAALGGALALVLVGALRREPEPTPRTITPLTPPTTLRSLDARPELADHLARWLAAITAPDARPLAEFYAASVQFTGSEGLATVADMAHYWRDLRGVGGTFQVDWSQSRWYSARLDPGVATDAACLAAASDGSEVVLVRARAVQNEPGRAARTGRQVPCERLEGVYLLWLRGGGARWRICHETWSLEEGVCASCPAARECRRGRARR